VNAPGTSITPCGVVGRRPTWLCDMHEREATSASEWMAVTASMKTMAYSFLITITKQALDGCTPATMTMMGPFDDDVE